jgi:5-methylcytosine-specific restriction endonuclease McrA
MISSALAGAQAMVNVREMRTCKTCGETKPLDKDHFHARPTGRGGFRPVCKICANNASRPGNTAYKEKNIDKRREYNRNHGRAKRQANPEAARRKYREWYRNNLEKNRLRALRRNAGWVMTQEAWNAIVEFFGGRCAYCYEPLAAETIEIEHFMPLSRGGLNNEENIVPSCRTCNRQKHNKTPLEIVNGTDSKRILKAW